MYSGINNDFLYSVTHLQVTFGNGVKSDNKTFQGTGFFVNSSSGKVSLITNRHVLDLEYSNPKYVGMGYKLEAVVAFYRNKDLATGLPDIFEQLLWANSSPVYFPAGDEDLAIMPDPKFARLNRGGTLRLEYSIPTNFLADISVFNNHNTCVGDLVSFPGFPEWFDKTNYRPILRSGTLSSDPRYPYRGSGNLSAGDLMAYEAFSYGGSSGSPVFALQKGFRINTKASNNFRELYLIGINCGHLKIENSDTRAEIGLHSGISYFLKAPIIIGELKKYSCF